jgi:glutamate/tyrosine decarboxylase-like PLP-dependent enzyme
LHYLLFNRWSNQGFAYRVDHAFENAQYFASLIKARPDRYKLVQEPVSVSVGFWCIPASIQHLSPGEEKNAKITELAHIIRGRMQKRGKAMVTKC